MTTSLAPLPVQRFVDNNGNALTGGKLFTYTAGTSTKQTTYTDSTGVTPNQNPIILNTRGECQVWLTQNIAYKFVLSPSTDTDPPTNSFWTVDNIQPGFGAIASGALLGNSSGVSAVPTQQTMGSGLSLSGGVLSMVPRNYLSGLTLSNDITTPNTVLDIASGFCTDSTNTVAIALAAFTKSISSSWVAGSGNAGMGTGISASASTWYHVFAIINGGNPDLYFDTSVTAAHAPNGTTAFRRLGSIKTDGGSHILSFTQYGDEFWWTSAITDVSSGPIGLTTVSPTISVPPNVNVIAICSASVSNSGSAVGLSIAPHSFGGSGFVCTAAGAAGLGAIGLMRILVNSTASIDASASVTASTYSIVTAGWVDTRGK